MQKIARYLIAFAILSTALLSACSRADAPEETQAAPEAVFTAAAQTASARMTENAAVTPTDPPPTPTETQALPSDTPTQAATTPAAAAATATRSPAPAGADVAEFVLDVTVPDGTTFAPGQAFVKTWRLKNAGSSTWTTAYSLVFSSGTQMGAPASVPMPSEVAPNGEVDISVNLVAPDSSGEYVGYFLLRNASGQNFGLGGPDIAFYVLIEVSSSGSSGGPTSTPDPDAGAVSGISLSVDEAEVETSCPHTFNFLAGFTLNEAATVTYELEAEVDFDLSLPAPTTAPLDAGDHTVSYTLEFDTDVSGWARFLVTAPESGRSSQVQFELTCSG